MDFSLELKVVEAKCKDLENRLKENQEGKKRIIHVKLFLSKLNHHNDACDKHALYCCVLFVDVGEVCVERISLLVKLDRA